MKIGLSPLQAGGNFEDTIRQCEHAEAAGFDSVWLGEHHNNPLLYPRPLLGLAAIASRTRRLRLGTGVLLLPLYRPLDAAEEGAIVDVISNGRLILGVGAGYAPEEFEAFDVSIKERGSRMDEAVPLIQRLWTEERVTHEGRHYRVTYRGARRETGRDTGDGDIALMRYLFVARSAAEARAIAGAPFIRAFEHTYFKWPHPVVKRPPGELTIERLAEDRIILGDPESCLRQLDRFRDKLGLSHLICRLSVAGIPPEAARESVDLFTREIMPPLR